MESEALAPIQPELQDLSVLLSLYTKIFSHQVKSIRKAQLCAAVEFRKWQEIKLYVSCSVFLRGLFLSIYLINSFGLYKGNKTLHVGRASFPKELKTLPRTETGPAAAPVQTFGP